MSNILFDPKNKSAILPRDVLNIIGTHVKHPLCDLVKNHIVHTKYESESAEITNICVEDMGCTIIHHYTLREKTDEQEGYRCKFMLEGIARKHIIYDEKKFNVKIDGDFCWLSNKIPMHFDTFYAYSYGLQPEGVFLC